MFITTQIIVWLLFLLFILSRIKRKYIRVVFSIIASLLSTFEILSVYLTGRLLDFRFYNHINLNAVEGQAFQFGIQIFVFFIYIYTIKWAILFCFKKNGQLCGKQK